MSREIVIKYNLLLNMNLIFNLGNFRAIRLWIWPGKVSFTTVVLTRSKFQRRFRNVFDFTLSFFQSFSKRWVNESSLLHVFYYILLCYTIVHSYAQFKKVIWDRVDNNPIGTTLDLQYQNRTRTYIFRKTKSHRQHAFFYILSNWCCE